MTNKNIEQIIKDSNSKADVCRAMGLPINGSSYRKVNQLISSRNLDTGHFSKGAGNRKYEKIKKICPVCGTKFNTVSGGKEMRTVCSRSCANTYFRSGKDHYSYENTNSYRTICFRHHRKACVICGESVIVEVHHLDENHNNNNPENLIPLCPTHHRYWHSKHKHLIESRVLNYVRQWQSKPK